MNFDHNSEEETLLKNLDTVLDEYLADRDFESSLGADAAAERLHGALEALASTCYLDLPSADRGGPFLMSAMEAVASRSTSLFLGLEATARLFGRAVATFGDDDQRARWLEPLRRGRTIGALGLSEATVNIVNDPLTTRGERDGEDIVVTGTKSLVCNGPIADWFALVGMLDDEATIFLIEGGAEGLTVGAPVATTAWEGTLFAPITVEGCRVPASQVLESRTVDELLGTVRRWEDQILIGAALGEMKIAFAKARSYARTHKTSAGKPIVAFQEISFQLAEMLTLHQTAQLLAARAAWAAETRDPDAAMLSDCAKVFCTENAEHVTSMALQILSSEGLIRANPVDRAFRAAKAGRVLGTSCEVGRVQLGDDALRRWG